MALLTEEPELVVGFWQIGRLQAIGASVLRRDFAQGSCNWG